VFVPQSGSGVPPLVWRWAARCSALTEHGYSAAIEGAGADLVVIVVETIAGFYRTNR
jgi:hypothetical protein